MELLHTKDEIYDLWNLTVLIENIEDNLQNYKDDSNKSKYQYEFKNINQQLEPYKKIVQSELNKYKIYLNTKVIETSAEIDINNPYKGEEGVINEIIRFSPSGIIAKIKFNNGLSRRESLTKLKEA